MQVSFTNQCLHLLLTVYLVLFPAGVLTADDTALRPANGSNGDSNLTPITYEEFAGQQQVESLPSTTLDRVFSDVKIDIGRVQLGRHTLFNVPLNIESSEEEIVERLKTSCGCTVGVPSSMKFVPGETVNVLFKIKPKKVGVFNSKAIISFVGGRSLTLVLTGSTFSHYQISPAEIEVDQNVKSIQFMVVDNFPAEASSDEGRVLNDVACAHAEQVSTDNEENGVFKVEITDFGSSLTMRRRQWLPIQLTSRNGHVERHQILLENENAMAVRPKVVVPRVSDDRVSAKAFLETDAERVVNQVVTARIKEFPEVEVQLKVARNLGKMCFVEVVFSLGGDLSNRPLTIEWLNSGSVTGVETLISFP